MYAGVWAGIVIALFSIVFLVQSFDYSYENRLGPGPGPGFFPIWLTIALLILSLLYIVESWKGYKAPKEEMPTGKEFKNVLLIAGFLVVFIVTVQFLGFVLSSTLFLFLLLSRYYKWYSSVGISLSVSIILFWLFAVVLSVDLPVNGLGW